MNNKLHICRNAMLVALFSLGALSSCIREELPNINVDIENVISTVSGNGILKSTIQENGVIIYVDKSKTDTKNMDLDFEVSKNATYSYVDVEFVHNYINYYGVQVDMGISDTIVTAHQGNVTDFSQTRYIKVLAEKVGLDERDKYTPETFSKFGGIDEATGKLYKIFAIQVINAKMGSNKFTFDNWYSPNACVYEHPYEFDDSGQQVNVWASTNNNLGIRLKLFHMDSPENYGAVKTDDAVSGKALLLQTTDMRALDTAKPFVAGCCFLGELDGNDQGALTMTHIGLPFNQKPKSIKFYYKFHPGTVTNGNDVVPNGPDKGFIKAVLYRTDSETPYLNGATIRDNSYKNTIAYAEFFPDAEQSTYKEMNIDFKYINDFSDEELKNWKYNLAIYFASSNQGFVFVGSPETKLYIDEFEVVCE